MARMVSKLLIVVLLFSLNACGQKRTENDKQIKKDYKKPIYKLKIQAASPYEVSINDILIDYHYDSGAIDYDIDLNQWILNSGTVKLKAKIFTAIKNPNSNVVKKMISEYFKLSLYVYEKDDKTPAKQLLQEFKFAPQKEELSSVQESWETELKVPYKLKG